MDPTVEVTVEQPAVLEKPPIETPTAVIPPETVEALIDAKLEALRAELREQATSRDYWQEEMNRWRAETLKAELDERWDKVSMVLAFLLGEEVEEESEPEPDPIVEPEPVVEAPTVVATDVPGIGAIEEGTTEKPKRKKSWW